MHPRTVQDGFEWDVQGHCRGVKSRIDTNAFFVLLPTFLWVTVWGSWLTPQMFPITHVPLQTPSVVVTDRSGGVANVTRAEGVFDLSSRILLLVKL